MNDFNTEEEYTYNWIIGGKAKHVTNAEPLIEELRDSDGQIVPGCFWAAPCGESDDL